MRRMSRLFEPLRLRDVTLKNRIGMSPMCMFSAYRGHVTDFHRVHYPARASGGCGLIIVEATAVEPRGVIAPDDLGIWDDAHIDGLRELTRLITSHGAVPAIQLAHAGRKAGSYVVDEAGTTAMDLIAPSAIPFEPKRPVPRAMATEEMKTVRDAFVAGARRAVEAGFRIIELHMAHGYLLSSFLSPIPNRRTDTYGGDIIGRMRFPLEVIDAVRAAIPESMPLFVRVSSIDPEEGGQTIDDTIAFARQAKAHGVDLIDCSAGGQTPQGWLKARPGYQVKYAARVREAAALPTAAVGVITEPQQAERVLADGLADLVLLGRELLRNPYWAIQAQLELMPGRSIAPKQYAGAFSMIAQKSA